MSTQGEPLCRSSSSISSSKKERKSIYIVPFVLRIVSKCSDIDHTFFPANYAMPAFLKRSPDGANPN